MKNYKQLEIEIVLTVEDMVRTSVENFNTQWFSSELEQ